MFIPLVLCDQLECVVENLWLNYLLFSSYCLLYIAFLYCMWLPLWRIKLYIILRLWLLFIEEKHFWRKSMSSYVVIGDIVSLFILMVWKWRVDRTRTTRSWCSARWEVPVYCVSVSIGECTRRRIATQTDTSSPTRPRVYRWYCLTRHVTVLHTPTVTGLQAVFYVIVTEYVL